MSFWMSWAISSRILISRLKVESQIFFECSVLDKFAPDVISLYRSDSHAFVDRGPFFIVESKLETSFLTYFDSMNPGDRKPDAASRNIHNSKASTADCR